MPEVSALEQVRHLPAEQIFSRFSTMKQYIAVYVPSTVDVDITINNAEMVSLVQRELSEIFGGTSAYEVNGTFKAESGSLVAEKITVVKSFAVEVTGEMAAKVVDIAEHLKTLMRQESIGVEYNGQMMFV